MLGCRNKVRRRMGKSHTLVRRCLSKVQFGSREATGLRAPYEVVDLALYLPRALAYCSPCYGVKS